MTWEENRKRDEEIRREERMRFQSARRTIDEKGLDYEETESSDTNTDCNEIDARKGRNMKRLGREMTRFAMTEEGDPNRQGRSSL